MQPTSLNLPYALDALEPVISKQTLVHHLFQHHREHHERAASLISGTEFSHLSLSQIIQNPAISWGHSLILHHAAQAWSHDMYWRSLRPGAGGAANGPVSDAIRAGFGSFRRFVGAVHEAAEELIGNGWLWVTWRTGRMAVITTSNSNPPFVAGDEHVLLAIDLWEHAYYLDYFNARLGYVAALMKSLINWDFANAQLATAPSRAVPEVRSQRKRTRAVRTRRMHRCSTRRTEPVH